MVTGADRDAERTAEFCRPAVSRRTVVLLAVAIVMIALGLRLANVATALEAPLFNHGTPMNDAQYYDQLGREIAGGDWLGDEVFYLGPLYPYTLGALYRVVGHRGDRGEWVGSIPAVRYLQAVLGAVNALLLFLIAWRLGGIIAAAVTGLLAAFHGYFIYYDLLVMPSTQILFVHLVAIGFLLLAERSNRARWWLAAGFTLALCVLAHGSALVTIAALGPWLWLRRDRGWREKLLATALLAAAFAPVIGIVTARNWIVGDDLVLVTSNAGKNLYIGNNPEATGTFGQFYFPVWGSSLHYYLFDIPRSVADPAPSEVSKILADESLAFMKSEPAAAARLFGKKALLFLNWFETGTNDHYYFARRYLPVLALPLPTFGLVAPLGLVGLAVAAYRRWRTGLLTTVVLSQLACFTLMFVLARYRLVTVGCFMVLTGLLAAWAVERYRERAWPALLAALALVVPASLVVHVTIPGFDENRGIGQQHIVAAKGFIEAGRLDLADRSLRAAVGADFSPWKRTGMWFAKAHTYRAEIAVRRGLWDLAVEEAESGLQHLRENLDLPRTPMLIEHLEEVRAEAVRGREIDAGGSIPEEAADRKGAGT